MLAPPSQQNPSFAFFLVSEPRLLVGLHTCRPPEQFRLGPGEEIEWIVKLERGHVISTPDFPGTSLPPLCLKVGSCVLVCLRQNGRTVCALHGNRLSDDDRRAARASDAVREQLPVLQFRHVRARKFRKRRQK